ncbi:MAG: putative 4-hydroxybenzoate polyprenyltransferase [Acidobacteria bacterium]|nr:putative 4-hydroxybenzoate polyprenyltransferase [Acidobacteriota bacterium]
MAVNFFEKTKLTFSMIKFHHSIFALPFALVSYFWASKGEFDLRTFLLVIVAMVSARSVAMTLNRIIDFKYDIKNPRTKNWPFSKGELSKKFAYSFVALNFIVFEISAFMLNKMCFYLSPVALFFLIIYSYTKRWTFFCHLILGFTDGIAPVGAWIAVKEEFSIEAVMLCLAVTFWIAGFDILYSLQDLEFDKKEKLKSIPVKFGIKASLRISAFFHFLTYIFYLLAGYFFGAGFLYYLGLIIIFPLLVYEHLIIKPNDLSKINSAFFTVNGYVSIFILAFSLADLYWR